VGIATKNHFPQLKALLHQASDGRKRPVYEVEELLLAVIGMFLFRRGARNHADNTAAKGHYARNFEKLFGSRLPDLDTSHRLLKALAPSELEGIKRSLVHALLRKKVLEKHRLYGTRYLVGIDATGVHSFGHEPYPGCPHKTSKLGKRTWTAYVLEAKILCPNGFSISMATEWVQNPTGHEYEKQDCELKAFARLAQKIRSHYPRLPITIAADGLYPNDNVLKVCRLNGWKYIITLKDGNLPSVWEEAGLLKKANALSTSTNHDTVGKNRIATAFAFANNIDYKSHQINFLEAITTTTGLNDGNTLPQERFVHITDYEITGKNCKEISGYGRLRWKIENEGFNEQKNAGYNLCHKYSRKSFNATKNYYQCLQIAHMINQLAHKTERVSKLLQGHDTLKSYQEAALCLMVASSLDSFGTINYNCQMRY
jgi:predicted acetyltransferase